MKFKVWVEVMTVTHMTEEEIEVPDAEWAAMSEAEREARMSGAFDDLRDGIANGGWEVLES